MKLFVIAMPGILTALLFAELAYAQDAKNDPSGSEDSFSQDAAATDPLGKADSFSQDAAATDPLGKDDSFSQDAAAVDPLAKDGAYAQDTAQETPGKSDPSAQDRSSSGRFRSGFGSTTNRPGGFGGSSSFGGFRLNAAAEPKKSVRILRLVQLEPQAVAETLKQLFQSDIAVTAYAKTNTLVIYGTEEQIQQAEKLVEMLEKPGEKQRMMGEDYSADMYDLPMAEMMKRSSPDAEQQSLTLADRYRMEAQRLKADDPRLKQLEAQLQKAVAVAFQVRQEQHWAELQRLEQKVKQMKNLVEARNRIKSEIIDRRVDDLKNPNRVWEESPKLPASHPNVPIGGPGAGVFPLGSPIGIPGPAAIPPISSQRGASALNPKSTPYIQGVITAVSPEEQLVELSVGADDGVKLNTTLIVSRDNKFLGQIEVIELLPNRCMARINKDDLKAPMQRGDHVRMLVPIPPQEAIFPSSSIPNSLQLKLAKPEAATFHWTTDENAASQIVILPARINVPTTKTAMFQIDNLEGHPNLMLFGTFINSVEAPAAKTYALHNAVNIQFTNEDIEQASLGNLLTKVFYVPNKLTEAPDALGVEELVSSRLDPGLDPVEVAKKRGDLLGVMRLGNRHSNLGENEDWHEKFLRNSLKAVEAERESVKEELIVCEDALLENAKLPEESLAQLRGKIVALKDNLASLEERRELYLKEMASHAEKPQTTGTPAPKSR